jgi:hypothetical protein
MAEIKPAVPEEEARRRGGQQGWRGPHDITSKTRENLIGASGQDQAKLSSHPCELPGPSGPISPHPKVCHLTIFPSCLADGRYPEASRPRIRLHLAARNAQLLQMPPEQLELLLFSWLSRKAAASPTVPAPSSPTPSTLGPTDACVIVSFPPFIKDELESRLTPPTQ